MEVSVVYYSKTGRTKKVAEEIAERLACEVEGIIATSERKGPIGYLKAGRDAVRKRSTTIGEMKSDPALYQLTIIGTPVWALTISAPVRAYLQRYSARLRDVAFFLTYGGAGAKSTFEDMEEMCSKRPVATLEITTLEYIRGRYGAKLDAFINAVQEHHSSM
ncbi:MAG: hypothetical protein AB1665_03680 [Candidatus Thermoplasmatota archaeon]